MKMNKKRSQRRIAYRCPECGVATVGLVGKFVGEANMIRLKCSCDVPSSLDINVEKDGKVKLAVPCILCKQSHTYTVTEGIFFEREHFTLACPFAGMDIAFIGGEESVGEALSRTEGELRTLMSGFEAEELSDLQPQDMTEDEILPDPAVYDTLRFVVKDLEAEGKVFCPCAKGEGYDLRFAEGGIDVFCPSCGASVLLAAASVGISEEYLTLDSLTLK